VRALCTHPAGTGACTRAPACQPAASAAASRARGAAQCRVRQAHALSCPPKTSVTVLADARALLARRLLRVLRTTAVSACAALLWSSRNKGRQPSPVQDTNLEASVCTVPVATPTLSARKEMSSSTFPPFLSSSHGVRSVRPFRRGRPRCARRCGACPPRGVLRPVRRHFFALAGKRTPGALPPRRRGAHRSRAPRAPPPDRCEQRVVRGRWHARGGTQPRAGRALWAARARRNFIRAGTGAPPPASLARRRGRCTRAWPLF
jgi:hypothetical protein